jgi:signal transduction histidine kinase
MDSLSQEVYVIVIGCAFFLLVAIGIIFLVLIYQKRQLRYILEKRQLQNQYTEELLKTRLETQEQTLNMISKEIHDNIGQLLNSSKILIGVAQRRLNTTEETLQIANETLGHAIQELRALSKSLSKDWLEQFDLIQNLDAEVARINAADGIRLSVTHPPTLTMPKERQLVLFRIVQESFQNALKHSEARNIHIVIEQRAGQLQASITDDGKGLDPDPSRPGFGITNIKMRTALMGGTVQWKPAQPGTEVLIQIPING